MDPESDTKPEDQDYDLMLPLFLALSVMGALWSLFRWQQAQEQVRKLERQAKVLIEREREIEQLKESLQESGKNKGKDIWKSFKLYCKISQFYVKYI